MPASMSSVTTRGFGNGTFNGSAALVVTLGFGLGAAAAVSYSGGWIAETRQKVLIAETRSRVWIAGKK